MTGYRTHWREEEIMESIRDTLHEQVRQQVNKISSRFSLTNKSPQ